MVVVVVGTEIMGTVRTEILTDTWATATVYHDQCLGHKAHTEMATKSHFLSLQKNPQLALFSPSNHLSMHLAPLVQCWNRHSKQCTHHSGLLLALLIIWGEQNKFSQRLRYSALSGGVTE